MATVTSEKDHVGSDSSVNLGREIGGFSKVCVGHLIRQLNEGLGNY